MNCELGFWLMKTGRPGGRPEDWLEARPSHLDWLTARRTTCGERERQTRDEYGREELEPREEPGPGCAAPTRQQGAERPTGGGLLEGRRLTAGRRLLK